jgi:hypothetical protein
LVAFFPAFDDDDFDVLPEFRTELLKQFIEIFDVMEYVPESNLRDRIIWNLFNAIEGAISSSVKGCPPFNWSKA